MDPHQTFLDMFQAMKDEDHATARELALALQRWFAKGGFCPDEFSPEVIHLYIESVLRRTIGDCKPELPFSLVCLHCDAGEGLAYEEEAMDAGWTEIEPASDLLQANFLGICPDCRR